MGSNYKSYGGKCGCSKRVKKAQRVPQRGPGVAELEKILSDQKQDLAKPLYTPNGPSIYNNQPHYHVMRPVQHQPMMPPLPPLPRLTESHFPHSQLVGGSGNVYVKPWRTDERMKPDQVNPCNDSGLSFTRMMMMGDTHDPKPFANLAFQTNMMNNSYPSPDVPNHHFNKNWPSQNSYSTCPPISPEEDKCAMKKAGGEMPSHPHPFYTEQLSQTSNEIGRTKADHERMMLRNVLTLGPPSPTKGSASLPLNSFFIESDSSEGQCKDIKPEDSYGKTQIFGFNLQEKKYLSLDDTKLSLHHNAVLSELSLDLTLKL